MSAQIMSRGSGRSVTAAAAYRAGGRIADEHTNQIFDYARRKGVVHTEIMAPQGSPLWMLDREKLWNAVERAERRKDAQLCREVQLALPHELDRDSQLTLVRTFVSEEFVSVGMIADIAVHVSHKKGDPRNDHAHVMLTLRELTGEGFGNKCRDWNERTLLVHWREAWADQVNRALETAGQLDRVDHRTLEAQRIDLSNQAAMARAANDNELAQALDIEVVILDREPEPKIGHKASALERRGVRTERGNRWREVVARNLKRMQSWLLHQRLRLGECWERLLVAVDGKSTSDPENRSRLPNAGLPLRENANSEAARPRQSLKLAKRALKKPPQGRQTPKSRRP
ncbi:MobQ family relaxase [Devosia yakushimensis]|nr:MobQ family relaxase [Devosia yakushimensis]